MNTSLIILGFQLTVGLPEIIISLVVALALGFSIHFFWTSKKSMSMQESGASETLDDNDNWKLKYYNDMDMQERAQQQLRERLAEARENEQILTIELEETQKELENLSSSQKAVVQEAPRPVVEAGDYLSQLKSAQENLFEHNHNISRLLEQIEMLKESEKKYSESVKANEQLTGQLSDIRKQLLDKEGELNQLRQQQRLGTEIA